MNAPGPLIEISRYYGDNPAYVIAGGGNTSFKDDERIWIKASGIPLAGIEESGFVCLSREKLSMIESKTYSTDPVQREEEVKSDMKLAIHSPENLRPSVETSLHNLIDYPYVIHTHPTLVNGLLCANTAGEEVKIRFREEALYVEYTDPGFVLFKKLQEQIRMYRLKHGRTPPIIFLQNHGVFVGGQSIEEVKGIYALIESRISAGVTHVLPSAESSNHKSRVTEAVKEYFSSRGLVTRSVTSALIDHFMTSREQYDRISRPFTPDIIVYCKSNYLFIPRGVKRAEVKAGLENFESTAGYYPKVILEEQGGLIAVEENESSLQTVIEVFLDLMKISFLSEHFGGPHFMTPEQIRFIDNWEVEHYRRKVAKGL